MLISVTIFLLYHLQTAVIAEIFDGNGEHGISVIFPLAEEHPVGTLIGNLIEKLGPKSPSSSSVLFTPLGQERYIRLNQTSGQLFVRSRIDREALCEQVGTCCSSTSRPQNAFSNQYESDDPNSECALHLLVIDQRDPGPSNQPKLVNIIFNIIDINDNPPKWSPDTLEIEVPEHSPIGTTIQLPEATDPDQKIESAPIRYELLPQVESINDFSNYESRNIGDMFMLSITPLDPSYGVTEKLNLQLKINCDLDRERRDQYRLLLIATDGGNKSPVFGDRTGTLNIIIKVTDINDQAPYFPEEYPSIEVSEDVALGTRIFTMTAKDNDPSDASRLVYRFASTATGEVMRLFKICEKTGAITVAQELDYETAPLLSDTRTLNSLYGSQPSKGKVVGYIIPVKVTDGVHFAQADLRVRLKNVNDNAPNITVQSHLPRWRNTNDLLLPEDAAVGTMIATITMEDADERWLDNKLEGGFIESHCVTAHPFFAIQPLFPNARYQYMLVTARNLDRETKSTHTISIACHDSGQPVLSRGVHITIRLEDLNDSPPVFNQVLYQSKIQENLPPGTPIDKIQATDADIGLNGAIRYAIKSNMDLGDLIKLDPVSGQIYSATMFDREKIESINFTVIAMDCAGGIINKSESNEPCSPIHSATASVVIMIEDVNDCVPEFDQSNYEFVVKEGQRPQQSIGSVHAIDNDADIKNSRIQYSISESVDSQPSTHPGIGNGEGYRASSLFAITSNGEIYTRNLPIDREKTPILSFTVIGSDYGHPSLSAFANVVIRVQDVNDHSPVWVFPQSSNSRIVRVNMSSHATVGREIAHLKAVDADSGPNGEIEYSIIKGNEYEYFALDKASGTLYLAKPLINGVKTTASDKNGTETTNQQASEEPTPQSFILALKASDMGKTPRSNTTVLKIDVIQDQRADRSMSQYNQYKSTGRHTGNFVAKNGLSVVGDRDLMIITAMIVVALTISFVLIAAIVFLRCRQPQGPRQNVIDLRNDVGGGRRFAKRLEILNCLGGAEATAENKNLQTAAFILTDTEQNPNFEEHLNSPHYESNNETPVHGALQMLQRESDVYGGFPPAVFLASSTLPGGRKVPIIATPADGAPIGYMVTSNPATLDSKFITYEAATLKQHHHQQPMGSDDASSSSADNTKNNYNSLLYRIPDGSSVTVEKNYMTINPELFQQSIYRRLQVPDKANEPTSQEGDRGSKKKVVVVAHENSPVRECETERKKTPKEDTKIKKHCRFSNAPETAEITLFSQPNNSRRSPSK
ncbi:hypothetical protein Aperf_G00000028915 [Anoplocephala perfoliata]